MHVLLVEDDPNTLKSVEPTLRAEGFAVHIFGRELSRPSMRGYFGR